MNVAVQAYISTVSPVPGPERYGNTSQCNSELVGTYFTSNTTRNGKKSIESVYRANIRSKADFDSFGIGDVPCRKRRDGERFDQIYYTHTPVIYLRLEGEMVGPKPTPRSNTVTQLDVRDGVE